MERSKLIFTFTVSLKYYQILATGGVNPDKKMDEKLALQLGVNPKNGIYEVFVNHQDYFSYYGLGTSPSPNFNQKMFAVVWDGDVQNLCLSERKAWAELKSIAEEEGVTID